MDDCIGKTGKKEKTLEALFSVYHKIEQIIINIYEIRLRISATSYENLVSQEFEKGGSFCLIFCY